MAVQFSDTLFTSLSLSMNVCLQPEARVCARSYADSRVPLPQDFHRTCLAHRKFWSFCYPCCLFLWYRAWSLLQAELKKKNKEDITVGREQISQDGVFRLSPHILQIMTMTEIIDSTVHAHHEVRLVMGFFVRYAYINFTWKNPEGCCVQLCCVMLWLLWHGWASRERRGNYVCSLTAPRTFFQPLSLSLAYPGFSEQCKQCEQQDNWCHEQDERYMETYLYPYLCLYHLYLSRASSPCTLSGSLTSLLISSQKGLLLEVLLCVPTGELSGATLMSKLKVLTE